MTSLKQTKAKTFALKQAHFQKEKKQRQLPQRHIPKIQRMNPSQLLDFMQNSFDDFCYRNSDISVQINKKILQRIRELKEQFENKNSSQYYEFLRKGGLKITKQQQQKCQINGHIPQSIKINSQNFIFVSSKTNYKIERVTIHSKDEQLSQTAYFYLQSIQKNGQELSYKRIKKESIEILSRLIELINKIKEFN